MNAIDKRATWVIKEIWKNGGVVTYECTGSELYEKAKADLAPLGLRLRRNASIANVHAWLTRDCKASTRKRVLNPYAKRPGQRMYGKEYSA